jgi:hypothetical protein
MKGLSMDEENMEEIPYTLENGLSRQEHKWLTERFMESEKLQQEQLDLLRKQIKVLRTMNTTIQIIAVIVLVSVIISVLQVLGI